MFAPLTPLLMLMLIVKSKTQRHGGGAHHAQQYIVISQDDSPNVIDFEEYNVEHAISTGDAKKAAIAMNYEDFIPPTGCKECSSEEVNYCLSSKLINDHCCCDGRFRETYPYVPHTCFLGRTHCEPIVKDCATYLKLRACCCNKLLYQKWKIHSSSTIIRAEWLLSFLSWLLLVR